MYRLFIFMMSMVVASPVIAGEDPITIKEVVVSATKIEESIEETTSSVKIIKSETIEKMNVEFVSDVLKMVPELNIVQQGGVGRSTTLYLRGGSPDQTLVMIDGVKVKSTTLGYFDFSSINADNIERIEIVKGAQSTIYGSDAMAGVINIITKKGRGEAKTDLSFEAGSYGTYSPSATVAGGSSKFDYRITGSYYKTDGISARKSGTEKDGYENTSISGKIGANLSDEFELEFTGKFNHDKSDLDVRKGDDLNFTSEGDHYIISGKGKLYLYDKWEQVLSVSRISDSLEQKDPDTASNNSEIITSINTVDWQHNLYPVDSLILTFGGEYRKESGENKGKFDKSVNNKALYLNNKLKLLDSDLVLNAGMRYDAHETFGDKTTYRIGGVYNIRPAGLAVRASYGTGFRAPTFNDLFYPFYGNLDLKPEESESWEVGLDKEIIKDRIKVSLTYFNQQYDDMIKYNPDINAADNIRKAEIKGFEADVVLQVTNEISLTSAYSHYDSKDKDTDDRLRRVPLDKVNITADYAKGPCSILVSYTYVSEVFESSSIGNLASYSLVNLSGGYRLNNKIKLFGRIENLFDEDYETASGYNTLGFSAYGGVKVSI